MPKFLFGIEAIDLSDRGHKIWLVFCIVMLLWISYPCMPNESLSPAAASLVINFHSQGGFL